MTQQEQIKEIKQILIKTSKRCRSSEEDYMQSKYAEAIYNAGYKKLPEDAIILTKEEYIDLSQNYVKEQKEQAVKEFAEKLKEKARGLTLEGDKGPGFYIGNVVLTNDIDKLLKEYEK